MRMKAATVILLSIIMFLNAVIALKSNAIASTSRRFRRTCLYDNIKRDDQGYEIKPRDWFNGLSLDPGASLTDPRAVPPDAKAFAERIKNGEKQKSFDEVIQFIDKHYTYFAVPFSCGDVKSSANTNLGSAKVFSFALMTKMNVDATLRLFAEHYDAVISTPNGTDHPNIRNFIKLGWSGVTFETGLAIVSKLQAYDDTDSAMATQAVLEGKGNAWDQDSDSWIP